jgi:hypothetical protein
VSDTFTAEVLALKPAMAEILGIDAKHCRVVLDATGEQNKITLMTYHPGFVQGPSYWLKGVGSTPVEALADCRARKQAQEQAEADARMNELLRAARRLRRWEALKKLFKHTFWPFA